MARTARYAPGGMVYHVLNRGVGRRTLFDKDGDYLAFERVLEETLRTRPMRVCGYCLMPNHWHFVVWPEHDGDLPAFMRQMTNTHVKRWKRHRHEIGFGHLYQERYRSFPVETEAYFYQVVRYVERNALRANLAPRAESWRWSSLRRGEREDPALRVINGFAPQADVGDAPGRSDADGRGRQSLPYGGRRPAVERTKRARAA